MNRKPILLAVLLPIGMLLALMSGCQTTDKDYEQVIARFYLEANPQEGYAERMVLPLSQEAVPVNPKAAFVEIDYVDVDLVQVDLGLCMNFSLTPAAARDLYRLSVNNLGSRLVLTLNGVPYGVRQMNTPLSYGQIMIFAELSDEDLEKMVSDLKKTTAEVQEEVEKGS